MLSHLRLWLDHVGAEVTGCCSPIVIRSLDDDGSDQDACSPLRCSDGYYGNPRVLGGTCQPCNCNPEGSISRVCDQLSGKCACFPGITGSACDECRPRHTLVNGFCRCKLENALQCPTSAIVVCNTPFIAFFDNLVISPFSGMSQCL